MMKWWHRWRIVRLEARAGALEAQAVAMNRLGVNGWAHNVGTTTVVYLRDEHARLVGLIAYHRHLLGVQVPRAIVTTDVVG